MTEKKEIPELIEIRLIKIKLSNFSISVLDQSIIESIVKEEISFEFTLDIKKVENNGNVTLKLITKFYFDNKNLVELGEMTTEGDYFIKNFKEAVKGGVIPENIILSLASSLLSTSRGFYILRTERTFLEGTIVPLIDMKSFHKA